MNRTCDGVLTTLSSGFVAAVSLVNRNSGMVIADNFSAFALPFLSIPLTERDAVVTYWWQWRAHTAGYAGSIPAVPIKR